MNDMQTKILKIQLRGMSVLLEQLEECTFNGHAKDIVRQLKEKLLTIKNPIFDTLRPQVDQLLINLSIHSYYGFIRPEDTAKIETIIAEFNIISEVLDE